MIVEWIRLVAFFGIGKMWACFHEVGKMRQECRKAGIVC